MVEPGSWAGGSADSSRLTDGHEIGAREDDDDDDGVSVVAHLLVSPFFHIGDGDEHPKLPMLDPAEQARKLF